MPAISRVMRPRFLIVAGLIAWAQLSLSQTAVAQSSSGNQWTWMGGGSTLSEPGGVSGTLGTPAPGNTPLGRQYAMSWTDAKGNFWLYGGDAANSQSLDDLWEFNPSTYYWTWMGGNTGAYSYQPAVYGTLRTPATGNIPESLYGASTWTDSSGNLWLFGGYGLDVDGNSGSLNDLWEFNPFTGEWGWMAGAGDNRMNCALVDYVSESYLVCGYPGVFGTLGAPAVGNIPTSRLGASSWTDRSGNLWLFGGAYNWFLPGAGGTDFFNDLWEFNTSTNEWTWMAGSSPLPANCVSSQAVNCGQSGVFGTEGSPATGNIPSSRVGAASWTDSSGNFWLYGGEGFDSSQHWGYLNDLWEFNPSTNKWAWMSGSSVLPCNGCGEAGTYGTLNTPAAGNVPGGRQYAASWTDATGNLWIFGGQGYDANGTYGDLNDMWEFNPTTNQWTWMSGSSALPSPCSNGACGQPGAYGTQYLPATGNVPGGRSGATTWTDSSGHLWLFGGSGYDATGTSGYLDDLWEYQPSTGSAAAGATTTTLTPAPSPSTSVYGEPVTLSATVSSSGGAPPNGENVSFLSGTTSLGTAQLSNGVATLTTAALPVGTDSIAAVYSGDANLAASVSTSVNEIVGKASSTTTLSLSPNTSIYGQTVNMTATVTGQYGGMGTGMVEFFFSGQSLGSLELSAGAATLPTSSLPLGTDPITAVYIASTSVDYTGSTSNAVNEVVGKASSITSIGSSPNPSIVGQAVTFTATVWAQGSNLTGTGTVTFLNGSGASIGSAALTDGFGTLTTTALPQGTESITGNYSGDTNFTPSTSNTVSQVVNAAPTNPVPTISFLTPALVNAGSGSFTVTVSGSGFGIGSTVYWGNSALATTYGSAYVLTAQVPAADVASAGVTVVTVQTPAPGGGTSGNFAFEVDSASGAVTGPTFNPPSATVTAGSAASYPVTLPSTATSVSATCLNLPAGAACSYSATTGAVTIATSSTTPAGTYHPTVVFTETLPGTATAGVLLPILLLPLALARRKRAAGRTWPAACFGFILMAAVVVFASCGGGGGGSVSTPVNPTYQVTSSGTVVLTVQ